MGRKQQRKAAAEVSRIGLQSMVGKMAENYAGLVEKHKLASEVAQCLPAGMVQRLMNDLNTTPKPRYDWPDNKWTDLAPIMYKDMYINRLHGGQVLKFRVITPPAQAKSIMFFGQDENDSKFRVAVYKWADRSYSAILTSAELNSHFPLNSMFLLRNPWLKLAVDGHGPILRVENPADLKLASLLPDPCHPVKLQPPAEAAQLDIAAKAAFNSHELQHALELYMSAASAAQASNEHTPCATFVSKAFANCSLISRKLGDIAHALEFAEKAVAIDSTWWRAHYRVAEARVADKAGRKDLAAKSLLAAWTLHPELLEDSGAVRLALTMGWFDSEAFRSHFRCRFKVGSPRIIVGTLKSATELVLESLSLAIFVATTKPEQVFTAASLRLGGTTVVMLPGLYSEEHMILLKKCHVDIIGLGGVTVQNAQPNSPTFELIGGSDVRMQSVTILQTYETLDVDSPHNPTAISVREDAELTLEECIIKRRWGLCMGVCHRAKVCLHNVEFHDSYGAVVIGDSATMNCKRVRVFDMRYCGLEIKQSASVHVEQSIVRHVGKNGILCHAGSPKLVLQNTELSQTGSLNSGTIAPDSALMIMCAASGVLEPEVVVNKCKILDNFGYGLYFTGVSFLVEDTIVVNSAIGSKHCTSVPFTGLAQGTFRKCIIGDASNPTGGAVQIMANGGKKVTFDKCSIKGAIRLGPDDIDPVLLESLPPYPSTRRENVGLRGMKEQIAAGMAILPHAVKEGKFDTAALRESVPDDVVKKMADLLPDDLVKMHASQLKPPSFKSMCKARPGMADPERFRSCQGCGTAELSEPDRKFLLCGTCKSAFYCSAECQKRDWKAHKVQCSLTVAAKC